MSINELLGPCDNNSVASHDISCRKLYLDDGFGDCFKIPIPNSYFMSNGVSVGPVPKANYSNQFSYAQIIVSAQNYIGVNQTMLFSITQVNTISGLTVSSPVKDNLIISEPGKYVLIFNIRSGGPTSRKFELTPDINGNVSEYGVGLANTAGFSGIVFSGYYNLSDTDVPFNISLKTVNLISVSIGGGSHVSIFRL